MPRAFRIVKAVHVRTAMSGLGAQRFGGRWNCPGNPVVYMSQSLALAALEILAHLPRGEKLPAFRMVLAGFDEDLVESVDLARQPRQWKDELHQSVLQRLGTAWLLERRSAVLRVPSAIIPGEDNYLLNPVHPEFEKISVEKPRSFWLDARLVK